MLTKEEAALLYRNECALILEEILTGRAPHLTNGLCRLIASRTDWAECDFGFDRSIGYAISREVMTGREYCGYLGQQGVWTPKRLGFVCGVVAMTEAAWVARVNAGTPS